MSYSSINYTPGYTADPSQVFVVTGYNAGEVKNQSKTDLPGLHAHYVIAQNDFVATQVVLKRLPDFVPMGCSNLQELKKFVIEMEAVRLGVKKPLGMSVDERMNNS